MDNYNVRRKVNRNVIKAVRELINEAVNDITSNHIINRAKYLMRNCIPLTNLDHIIRRSLGNLTKLGLIICDNNSHYTLSQFFDADSKTDIVSKALQRKARLPQCDPRMFKKFFPNVKKLRSVSNLDPSKRRRISSEDSLSGDKFEKSRKRYRSNNKTFFRRGRAIALPRARKYQRYPKTRKSSGLKRQMSALSELSTVSPVILEPTPTSSQSTMSERCNEPCTELKVFVCEKCNGRVFRLCKMSQSKSLKSRAQTNLDVQSVSSSRTKLKLSEGVTNISNLNEIDYANDEMNAPPLSDFDRTSLCSCNSLSCVGASRIVEARDVAMQTSMLHLMTVAEWQQTECKGNIVDDDADDDDIGDDLYQP